MEKQIEQLSLALMKQCVGQQAGVVIGAAFNLIQTSLNMVPDKRVLAAVAQTLRHQANVLDDMASGKRH